MKERTPAKNIAVRLFSWVSGILGDIESPIFSFFRK